MTPDLILEPTNPSSSHVLMDSIAIEVEITLVRSIGDLFFAQRKAHAPLPARAHVDHGVRVIIAGNYQNRAAGSGCHDASFWASYLPISDSTMKIAFWRSVSSLVFLGCSTFVISALRCEAVFNRAAR